MKRRVGLLVLIGTLQMIGALTGLPALTGIGAASAASPAPKVFTSVQGLETFSSTITAEWTGPAGREHVVEITPERYAGVEGPYPRRNALGAAVAYGPVLSASPHTRSMVEAIGRHAVCGEAPLLRELELAAHDRIGPFRLRVTPRSGSAPVDLPLVMEVHCP